MPDADVEHGHSHGHGHELAGGWGQWLGDRTLRLVLIGVAAAALATAVAVVALWPSGDGRRDAIANADEIGLATDRFSATVETVTDQPCSYSTSDDPQFCRELTLIVHEGPDPGSTVILPEFNLQFDRSGPNLSVGDKVILGYEESTDFYFFADRDRRTTLVVLAALFAVFVIALGRFRGALALLAMGATLVILVTFVAPSVLDGNDPLLVSVVAASAIAFVSLYLTHGFSPTTTVALAGTLFALGLTLALSWVFFELSVFTGLATEEALILPFIAENLDVRGLLLGGAIIGALGALDDVTVTQVATVAELRNRRPDLSTRELVTSGIRVGREHIASTVNTLLLAYAGASMPLLLLFAVADQPLEMVANSELIAVEIVRTLCGSIGLVAAVPITTSLAAIVVNAGSEASDDEASAAQPLELSTPVDPPEPTSPPERPISEPAPEPAPNPEPRRTPAWEDFAPVDPE
ncbi:MAG: YibE/F family protein [Acidimicrobiales bacterium]